MQKIIIQTREGKKFLVCADFPEPKDNAGFIRVSGFRLEECQDISPTQPDDPNYILNKLVKSTTHIEIKTCDSETMLILLERKRKPFSFQDIFGSRSRHYYKSQDSYPNVTVEEIFF